MLEKHRKADLCPLCGKFMDLYCTGNKHIPFVDGKTYDKLCFTCYHVPKTERQVYEKNGDIKEIIELPYSSQHLHTAQELVNLGPADTILEARKSVAAVRASIKENKPKRNAVFIKPKNAGSDIP